MAPVPRKALIAVSSATRPLYRNKQGKFEHETGAFITEIIHPFVVFKKAGFEVELVSETGGYHPDYLSLTEEWLHGSDRELYMDTTSEFRKKLDHMYKPSQINASEFGVFFASAGHASLIDYPTAKGLQKLALDIYTNGGIASSVCHGGAIFPGIIDPKTGKSIIAGHRVTGFTTVGEEEEGVMDVIESWHATTIENGAKAAGATCK